MTPRRPLHVIAASTEALVAEGDITDLLAALLDEAAEAMRAQAVGAVVVLHGGELDVLAATSHRADELELYQARHHAGPCVTCITTGEIVAETDPVAMAQRWPDAGPQIEAAGFTSIHAFPMKWHDTVLGGLNVFHSDPSAIDDDLVPLGQIYADLVSSLLLRPVKLTRDALDEKVGSALNGRILIEQAKGVVAYTDGVDMDVAYERLRQQAGQQDRSMTSLAEQILERKGRAPSG